MTFLYYDVTVYSYSSLSVSLVLAREFGFYFWDYYMPSVLVVILSWMTFWIEPDIVPARVWIGMYPNHWGMFTMIRLSNASTVNTLNKYFMPTWNCVFSTGNSSYIGNCFVFSNMHNADFLCLGSHEQYSAQVDPV